MLILFNELSAGSYQVKTKKSLRLWYLTNKPEMMYGRREPREDGHLFKKHGVVSSFLCNISGFFNVKSSELACALKKKPLRVAARLFSTSQKIMSPHGRERKKIFLHCVFIAGLRSGTQSAPSQSVSDPTATKELLLKRTWRNGTVNTFKPVKL